MTGKGCQRRDALWVRQVLVYRNVVVDLIYRVCSTLMTATARTGSEFALFYREWLSPIFMSLRADLGAE
jgi:hypothetical protein